MKKYFLVIDQGTTSSRIVLYNKKFEIFDIVQKEFKQFFPNEGWVEHNATEIWDDVRNLISKILRKNKLNSKNIISVNTDPDASIFNHSRFGVVADCNEFIKEIIEELKNSN